MAKPKAFVEEIIWYPVTGPQMCIDCGHNHWGWQAQSGSFLGNMAPQWRWCDQADCPCRSLRRRAAGVQPEGS
jgi:hypothetical protein